MGESAYEGRRRRWLRVAASPGVAVSLLVVVLSVAAFLWVTKHLCPGRSRGCGASARRQRCAGVPRIARARGPLSTASASALAGEAAPDQTHFESLVASETGTYLLADAMSGRARNRRGAPAIRGAHPRADQASPGHAARGAGQRLFPATFVTGLTFRPGTDVSALPALAATFHNSALALPGATDVEVVGGQRGFFLVETAQFARVPAARGSSWCSCPPTGSPWRRP